MTLTYQVTPSMWLGVHSGSAAAPRGCPDRLAADRASARLALAGALKASGNSPDERAVSLAHTEGVGAALVAPLAWRVGVDVVRIERVGRRHAMAILEASEWRTLAAARTVRPALAWALKEAAAKATRSPGEFFPCRLRIVSSANDDVGVLVLGAGGFRMHSAWMCRDRLLFAWVWAEQGELDDAALGEAR